MNGCHSLSTSPSSVCSYLFAKTLQLQGLSEMLWLNLTVVGWISRPFFKSFSSDLPSTDNIRTLLYHRGVFSELALGNLSLQWCIFQGVWNTLRWTVGPGFSPGKFFKMYWSLNVFLSHLRAYKTIIKTNLAVTRPISQPHGKIKFGFRHINSRVGFG